MRGTVKPRHSGCDVNIQPSSHANSSFVVMESLAFKATSLPRVNSTRWPVWVALTVSGLVLVATVDVFRMAPGGSSSAKDLTRRPSDFTSMRLVWVRVKVGAFPQHDVEFGKQSTHRLLILQDVGAGSFTTGNSLCAVKPAIGHAVSAEDFRKDRRWCAILLELGCMVSSFIPSADLALCYLGDPSVTSSILNFTIPMPRKPWSSSLVPVKKQVELTDAVLG